MMNKTGAQIFWECLEREGVEVIFGYPGGATLPIYDALVTSKIHHVLVRHEQGASHMADGYARASGRVGVALATSGPGATNLITGIATALMDSSPTVFITGQVVSPLIGYDAFQETDVTGITLPITKHNYLITDVNDIAPTIREAFFLAKSGRPGPVLIDITKDAQQATIDWEYDDKPAHLPGYRPDFRPANTEFERAVEMIHNAKKPLILAGHGILISGAMEEVLEFAERTQTPVADTLLGLGAFPGSHSLSLGMMGMHGEAWVNKAIQEADLLLAFGMRFDDRVTGKISHYAPNAKKIHIEIDPSEINKNVQVDIALVGDLKETLQKMLPSITTVDHTEWLDEINTLRGHSAVRDIKNLPDNGHLYAAHVINALWQVTKGEAIIVSDVGQNQMWTAQYYRHDKPNTSITSGGLGTMGFGLPGGIGAKFAMPDQEVWVIAGDGGIQMTMSELSTIAQEGIKVNIAILNNGYLGMVRQWQEFFYDKRYSATPMKGPDFVKIAEAHGLTGLHVDSRNQVIDAIEAARKNPGTVLIDFKVEKEDSVYPMVPTGAAIDAMIRRPLPESVIQES
ncbi:MAG: biosynthetic-type acetolactate synthase large subunit [Anaerolineaceae bacterium]